MNNEFLYSPENNCVPAISGNALTYNHTKKRYEALLFSATSSVSACTLSQPLYNFDSVLICTTAPTGANDASKEGGEINEFPISAVRTSTNPITGILGHLHENLGAGGAEYWYSLVCSSDLNYNLGVVNNWKKMLRADYTSTGYGATTSNYSNLSQTVIKYVKGVVYR